ncbi:MAG: hypothetical protein NTX17_00195 [Candidatus Eisenbacteria bacterium]|nr:hypothetical protein [Candidatus Eisenbacteria bacterium]
MAKRQKFVGYVSIPFGIKHRDDFTELYKKAIFASTALVASGEPSNVCLFREDEEEPTHLYEARHYRRLERFGRASVKPERRLRDEIQRHIILADFVIADISHLNPNVMLEVGFAQAIDKRIIYVTHTPDQFPSNLGDLKRRYDYNTRDLFTLKRNLWHKISEVIEEVKHEDLLEKEHGGTIEYFRERKKAALEDKFAKAQNVIQILTTNLMTVSAVYLVSILTAISNAKKDGRKLKVTILTSDPTNPFIEARANQLIENLDGYRGELEGSLKAIAAKLQREPHCKILTYREFPVQLWHRIDGTIYIGAPSLIRRSRDNCVFAVSVDIPGIKETFLDHFAELEKRARVYAPEKHRRVKPMSTGGDAAGEKKEASKAKKQKFDSNSRK